MALCTVCSILGCAVRSQVSTPVSPKTNLGSPPQAKAADAPTVVTPTTKRAQSQTTPAAEATRRAWPEQLAGRLLQVATDAYVLYANDANLAAELRVWLDRELAEFGSRYTRPLQRGLVLAIEPGEEPFPALEEWRARDTDRGPGDDGPTNRRGQIVPARYRRRYCFFHSPYFRENFSLLQEDARRIRILNDSVPNPAWVCVLTTEAHVLEAFDELRRAHEKKIREEGLKQLKDEPLEQWLCAGLFWLMYKSCVPIYRSIDVDLMHLQRHEVLWQTLIRFSDLDASRRDAALSRLQDSTDEAWEELYSTRPVE